MYFLMLPLHRAAVQPQPSDNYTSSSGSQGLKSCRFSVCLCSNTPFLYTINGTHLFTHYQLLTYMMVAVVFNLNGVKSSEKWSNICTSVLCNAMYSCGILNFCLNKQDTSRITTLTLHLIAKSLCLPLENVWESHRYVLNMLKKGFKIVKKNAKDRRLLLNSEDHCSVILLFQSVRQNQTPKGH